MEQTFEDIYLSIKSRKYFRYRGSKCHIVNIFKDGDLDLVVYKNWNKYTQSWEYECKNMFIVCIMIAPHIEFPKNLLND